MKRHLRRLYLAALSVALAAFALMQWPGQRLGRARRSRPEAPRRILVLRFGLLGDGTALLSSTLLRLRRRFPEAEIHVLATPLQRPLLADLPFVDEVLTWRAGDLTEPRIALRPAAWRAAFETVAALRRGDYDLALACYGRIGSAVALLSGAPRRLGYAGEAFPFTLTGSLSGARFTRPGWHEAHYGVALADLAGGGDAALAGGLPPDAPALRLCVTEDGRSGLTRLLPASLAAPPAGAGPAPDGAHRERLIALHPGATNGDAKRWPLPYWSALAGRLRRDGATVVLVGGPEDQALARTIRDAAGGDILDVTGKTSLPELLALLERADALVSGDSGPVHLAVAIERPVVAIHGPTDPRESGPFRAARAAVVRHALPCSPCYTLAAVADCPLGHTLCQRLVSPDEVHRALGAVLAQPAAPAGAAG
jgi:lipopolysaccharide heptosyltransferase II